MKTLIRCSLATVAFFSFAACTTVEERHVPTVHTTTTTTEESTIHHPAGGTIETQTTRNF